MLYCFPSVSPLPLAEPSPSKREKNGGHMLLRVIAWLHVLLITMFFASGPTATQTKHGTAAVACEGPVFPCSL